MSNLKLVSNLTKFLSGRASTARSARCPRAFVTAAPRPLQGRKDDEQCQNVKEAAEAVKDGAKQVKETTEFIRDVTQNTAESVTKMTKDVTDKVSETTEKMTEKAKGTVSGVWGTARAATEIIKDKVVGK